MADFPPRDHKGNLLDPGTDEPSSSAGGPQFTLGQVMKVVAVVAIGLAAVRIPDLSAFLCVWVFLLFLAAGLYGLSRLPPRVRLAIVSMVAVLLMLGFVWMLRRPISEFHAYRSERLAERCSTLAEQAADRRSSEMFLRESAKY